MQRNEFWQRQERALMYEREIAALDRVRAELEAKLQEEEAFLFQRFASGPRLRRQVALVGEELKEAVRPRRQIEIDLLEPTEEEKEEEGENNVIVVQVILAPDRRRRRTSFELLNEQTARYAQHKK